jgi:hypothetical protein
MGMGHAMEKLPDYNVEAYFTKTTNLTAASNSFPPADRSAVTPKSKAFWRLRKLFHDKAKGTQSQPNALTPVSSDAAAAGHHHNRPEEERYEGGLCSFCKTLHFQKLFTPSSENLLKPVHCHLEHHINWSLAAVKRNSRCSFCRLLLRTLSSTAQSKWASAQYIMGHIECFEVNDLEYPSKRDQSGRRLWITATDRYHGTYAGDEADSSHDHKECLDHRRTYDRCIVLQKKSPDIGDTVDPVVVRYWLSTCETQHGHICKPESSLPDPNFILRVIDTLKYCVVDAPLSSRYIALSYVWGDVKQFELRKTTLSVAQNLDQIPNTLPAMSKTVRDAMAFCRLIGERYLWVDTLCIIQDDDKDRGEQMSAMGRIYGSAFATIVAAAGNDANAGLPGVKGYTRAAPVSENVDGVDLMATKRHVVFSLLDSAWNSRGWTYQEKLFSKRRIVFMDDQARQISLVSGFD